MGAIKYTFAPGNAQDKNGHTTIICDFDPTMVCLTGYDIEFQANIGPVYIDSNF